MESKNAIAIIKLKELQAKINGMRLALTTSCSNCDVDSIVQLLKVISTDVVDTIHELEESKIVEVQEEEVSIEEADKPSISIQNQIDSLLDKSVDRTMNLSNLDMSKDTNSVLSQIPVHFDSPNDLMEDLIDGTNQ